MDTRSVGPRDLGNSSTPQSKSGMEDDLHHQMQFRWIPEKVFGYCLNRITTRLRRADRDLSSQSSFRRWAIHPLLSLLLSANTSPLLSRAPPWRISAMAPTKVLTIIGILQSGTESFFLLRDRQTRGSLPPGSYVASLKTTSEHTRRSAAKPNQSSYPRRSF